MKKETQNAHLFNFEDLKHQAETYLDSVRQRAKQILEEAASEVKSLKAQFLEETKDLRTEAEKKGYQDGLEKGIADAQNQIQQNVQERLQQEIQPAVSSAETVMLRLLEQYAALQKELAQNWEKSFLELICRISKAVIRRELKNDPQITLHWIREMLELSSSSNSFVLQMNPEDEELLKNSLEQLKSEFRQLGELEIKIEPSLERGDCILRSENGQLDQRLDVQLARIEEELRA